MKLLVSVPVVPALVALVLGRPVMDLVPGAALYELGVLGIWLLPQVVELQPRYRAALVVPIWTAFGAAALGLAWMVAEAVMP